MKKILLAVAIAVTACNLSLGISFAAVCQDTHGNRFCGNTCATVGGSTCACQGACSKEERDWVGGAGHEELLEVVYDY